MASRLNFQKELETVLGSRNVYFQPPESVRLSYPCIVYSRSTARTMRADNKPYIHTQAYQVIYIDKNPDSEIFSRLVLHFPMSSYDRHYVADNLHHDSITIYY